MTEPYSAFNTLAALLTIGAQIFTVVLAYGLWSKRSWTEPFIRHAISIAFLVAAGAVGTSLFYSEIAHFPPCVLCWWQRAFMYPAAILLGLGAWWKDKKIADYVLTLCLMGGLIAVYQFYGQTFDASVLPACSAAGGPSCAQIFFLKFGYISIPAMALTAFALISVLTWAARRRTD